MSTSTKKMLQAAAGSAGGDATLYVEQVFSTYLYTGNDSTQTITNEIDLAGEGGMVWFSARDDAGRDRVLSDTERGVTKVITSNTSEAESTVASAVTAFNSNGFSIGSYGNINNNNKLEASWTFRKTPGFFDVQTFTQSGTSGNQTIPHDLEAVPGFIVTKNRTRSQGWCCYHSSLGTTKKLFLDSTGAAITETIFTSVGDTSFDFSLAFAGGNDGDDYVVYLFADDDQIFGADEDESIIKCGSYTTDGSGDASVTLGFEPQWVLDKTSSYSAAWSIVDMMRGFDTLQSSGYQQAPILVPNSSAAESLTGGEARVNATGFTVTGTTASQTFIYVAIRRPMKVPEAGTEVYQAETRGETSPTPPAYIAGFPVDLGIQRLSVSGTSDWRWASRLTGTNFLLSNTTAAQGSDGGFKFDFADGWANETGTYPAYHSWMFRRAPEFMDVICWTGDSSGSGTDDTQDIPHNLGVVPEFMWLKRRSGGADWQIYHKAFPVGNYMYGDAGGLLTADPGWHIPARPTSSVVTVGDAYYVNQSGDTYIGYLFATLAGISKVGSYTADATVTTIDCGFSTGARFILIKKLGSGAWYVYDSYRGIVAGDDPYLQLNSTAAEITDTDWIDPDNSGFTITDEAGSVSNGINIDTEDYIFLAIA